MLEVVTVEQAEKLILDSFSLPDPDQMVQTTDAVGRVLAQDVFSDVDFPAFNRSTVDGFAVRVQDIGGCSFSCPAVLNLIGAVEMGEKPSFCLEQGQCVYIPTGGCLPEGADAVVMREKTETFQKDVYVLEPVGTGANYDRRGIDISKGQKVLNAGKRLNFRDLSILGALGITEVCVARRPIVSVFSTGNEIVAPGEPCPVCKIRDANSFFIRRMIENAGGEFKFFGIVPDDKALILEKIRECISRSDIVVFSGGSSAGIHDQSELVLDEAGHILFHGVAMKPGKPTICASVEQKAVFDLPGNPVAAMFAFTALVEPLIFKFLGYEREAISFKARCTERIPSNNGRMEYVAGKYDNSLFQPYFFKSSLLRSLSEVNSYIVIDRQKEGVEKGEEVTVYMWEENS